MILNFEIIFDRNLLQMTPQKIADCSPTTPFFYGNHNKGRRTQAQKWYHAKHDD